MSDCLADFIAGYRFNEENLLYSAVTESERTIGDPYTKQVEDKGTLWEFNACI